MLLSVALARPSDTVVAKIENVELYEINLNILSGGKFLFFNVFLANELYFPISKNYESVLEIKDGAEKCKLRVLLRAKFVFFIFRTTIL
jgi:hypothetical protein